MRYMWILLLLAGCGSVVSPTAEETAREPSFALASGAMPARVMGGCIADPQSNFPISRNFWYVRSGAEAVFFAESVPAGTHDVSAAVQWSLASCFGLPCPVHGVRRLRIYLGDTVVADDAVDGLEDIVTQQDISAVVIGAGCIRIKGYQVTTRGSTGYGIALLKKAATVE